jgi:hypothetical protein
MTTLDELLRQHERLTTIHIQRWVARGLLRPSGDADTWSFEQIDVARACLLAELASWALTTRRWTPWLPWSTRSTRCVDNSTCWGTPSPSNRTPPASRLHRPSSA